MSRSLFCHLVAHEYDAVFRDAERAVELHRYSARARDWVGDIYSNIGQTEKAVACKEETLQIFPNHLGTLMDLANEYPHLGREDDFKRVVDRISAQVGDSKRWRFATGYGILGHDETVRAILAEAERTEGVADSFFVATVYAALCNADKVFVRLNRAYEKRQFTMVVLDTRYFPVFNPYRNDPRYQALLEKLNFPEPRPEYQ